MQWDDYAVLYSGCQDASSQYGQKNASDLASTGKMPYQIAQGIAIFYGRGDQTQLAAGRAESSHPADTVATPGKGVYDWVPTVAEGKYLHEIFADKNKLFAKAPTLGGVKFLGVNATSQFSDEIDTLILKRSRAAVDAKDGDDAKAALEAQSHVGGAIVCRSRAVMVVAFFDGKKLEANVVCPKVVNFVKDNFYNKGS